MLRRSLGVLSLFALLVAACGGGGGGGAGKNVTCPAVTNGTLAATNGEVTVCAFDIRFDAKTITAPAGALKVTLVNKGSIPHTFEIDGQNFELKTSGHNELKSGTVTLAAGTYNFKCTIPGHASSGMAGKIVVS